MHLEIDIEVQVGECGLGLEIDDGLLFGKSEALFVCGVKIDQSPVRV